MTIQFFGVSCFKITTKIGNDEVSLVTDPYSEKVGKLPRNLNADVVTISCRTHDHYNNIEAAGEKAFLVEHPGEYEVRGIPIYGIASSNKNTIYHYLVDDVRVVHLGGLDKPLSDDQLAQIGEVDVLMVPVGGGDVLSASAAAELVTRLEPRVVIPTHYKMDGVTFAATGVEPFVKEIGAKSIETDKWKVTKKDLPQGETFVVLLSKA